MASQSENLRGAGFMALGMASFAASDTAMKVLGADIPLGQILVMRGFAACTILGLVCWAFGQVRFTLSKRDWFYLGLRGVGEIACAWFFLTALLHMNYADANAILQFAPLAMVVAGAVLFGEKVSRARLLAILLGFMGVMLIIRPGGAGFSIYSIYVLATVGGIVLRDLAARQLSQDVPVLWGSLMGGLAVFAFGIVLALGTWEPIVPLTSGNWTALTVSVVGIMGGYIGVVNAARHGDLGFVAPFRYSSLLVALIASALVFGILPDTLTLLGSLIVVATGIFAIVADRRDAA